MLDKLVHKWLGRPYHLAKVIDAGEGQTTVVLLHGLGRSGSVWRYVVEALTDLPYRVVAFDLLGFGKSPKPTWTKYDSDDHSRAVIASIRQQKIKGPVVLVGHSMGCLVAVRVARVQPALVKHLVLYEMPLYSGLPKKRVYQIRLNIYFRLYETICKYQPTFDSKKARRAERLASRIVGFEAKRASWQPFVKSLQNTIMKQTTAEDIKQLTMPADVIYGLFDMLVIRGKPQQTFGRDTPVTAHTVRASHVISKRASRFIVERIEAAEHPERVKDPKTKRILSRAKAAR